MKKLRLLTIGLLCAVALALRAQTSSPSLLLGGDYPDPTILREGGDYYMTHSAFDYVPGLTIMHSTDLVNWTPISYALSEYIGSIWAPDLCRCGDRYYIYFTVSVKGKPFKNYVVWANDLRGPWSKPIDLHVDGKIDPGHVVDAATGERWIFLAGGNRVKLTSDGLAAASKMENVYGGWPIPSAWDIGSVSLEGPKLKRMGDYYYYISAQGGTSDAPTSHMVVIARSKSLGGPWENMPSNPLIHTWSGDERWWAKGHGSLIDTPDGRMYMVYHAYEKNFLSLGRNTLVEPVALTADKWLECSGAPLLQADGKGIDKSRLGDFRIGLEWRYYKDYDPSRTSLNGGTLTMKAKGNDPTSSSPLLFIAGDHRYELTVRVNLKGKATAGLLLYYNSSMFAGIGCDSTLKYRYRRGETKRCGSRHGDRPMWLRVRNIDNILTAYTSYDGVKWRKEQWAIDLSGCNHNTLGDFQSVLPGLFAQGEGSVEFSDFNYRKLPDTNESLIVSYDSAVGNAALLKAAMELGSRVIYKYDNINAIAVALPAGMSAYEGKAYYSVVKGVLAVSRDEKLELH